MTVLTWDGLGEKKFESGVDHGVLYIPNESGEYDMGVAWNGLTGVTESPTGAEANKTYADNIVYGVLTSAEEFGATVTAYTYPPEFEQFDGLASPAVGVAVGQQPRGVFGMVYRTLKGDDIAGQEAGYKLHLLYGLTASPSEKAYTTINDSPEMLEFSWELTSVPVAVNFEDLKPTSVITVDSTTVDSTALAALEDLLFGTVGTDPSLPTPGEVIALFAGTATATDVVVAGDDDSINITGTTTNVLFTVEAWDGDEYNVVVGGDGVNEAAAEALVLTAGIHRVTLSAASGFYVPAAQQDVFVVTVT
jgi:hypothetical protein